MTEQYIPYTPDSNETLVKDFHQAEVMAYAGKDHREKALDDASLADALRHDADANLAAGNFQVESQQRTSAEHWDKKVSELKDNADRLENEAGDKYYENKAEAFNNRTRSFGGRILEASGMRQPATFEQHMGDVTKITKE